VGIPPSSCIGISIGNLAAESAERAWWACHDAHEMMAAKTSNGRKILRISEETTPESGFVSYAEILSGEGSRFDHNPGGHS
jgi:hypothetical protein